MLDARTLVEIPASWSQEAEYWRDTPFVWTRWTRPHEDWTHDHCRLCSACICDGRDRDPYDKPGPVEGGHYRYAFYAARPDGTYVWICRTCFKRVQVQFGSTLHTRRRRSTPDEQQGEDKIRVISAGKASSRERTLYDSRR